MLSFQLLSHFSSTGVALILCKQAYFGRDFSHKQTPTCLLPLRKPTQAGLHRPLHCLLNHILLINATCLYSLHQQECKMANLSWH